MEHQKDNWRVGYGNPDSLDIEAYFPYDNAWYAIASIELDDHGARPTAEQESDARMMAAAPDLAVELQKMVNDCECFGTGINYAKNECLICEGAREALAKTKGQSV